MQQLYAVINKTIYMLGEIYYWEYLVRTYLYKYVNSENTKMY